MWQRQIMEGEDFASPVVEMDGAKSVYNSTDLPPDRNWRFAPKA